MSVSIEPSGNTSDLRERCIIIFGHCRRQEDMTEEELEKFAERYERQAYQVPAASLLRACFSVVLKAKQIRKGLVGLFSISQNVYT